MNTIKVEPKWVRAAATPYADEGWIAEDYWVVRDCTGKRIGELACHYGFDELAIIAGKEAVEQFRRDTRLANVIGSSTLISSVLGKDRRVA